MSYNYAIYILSHGRANKLDTYCTLQKVNFFGKIYIVVDDVDDQLSIYEQLYGEQLLVFSKQDYLYSFDRCSRDIIWNIPLYARNFCIDHAKNCGYDYLLMLDDDITQFSIRFPVGNSLKCFKIIDFNYIINNWIDFLNTSDLIYGLCPAISSSYFGGLTGTFSKRLGRKVYQCYLLKVKNIQTFNSNRFEDFILSISNFDKLYFTDYIISFSTPEVGSNPGGIQYSDSLFDDNFYLKLGAVSGIEIKYNGKYIMRENNIYPKLISSKFKNYCYGGV